MRYNISKKQSTKPERIFYEALKSNRIPFKHRWIVEGYETDFLIDKLCIEIDGHEQNGEKNHVLANAGYTPIHFNNKEVTLKNINKFILNYVNNKFS